MADQAKIGTHWQDDELDAIVADYFAMLAADLAQRPYVKSQHSAELMARIGRTHRAVEFKHQNISAALDELGMPWIPGYIPGAWKEGGVCCRCRTQETDRSGPAGFSPQSSLGF